MRPKGRSCAGLCIQLAVYAVIAGGLAALTPSHSAAQEGADSPATDRLNVFLECGGRGCDLGFYQDQLAWVNWVSDPANADVQATLRRVRAARGRARVSGRLRRHRDRGWKRSADLPVVE